MSSIYRKGRDGYFYYQTYVDNPTSGKKDKRIFHSLGTKERSKAEKKQIELDAKYKRMNNKINGSFISAKSSTYVKITSLIIATIILAISVNDFNNDQSKNHLSNINNTINKETINQIPVASDSQADAGEIMNEFPEPILPAHTKKSNSKLNTKNDNALIKKIITPDYNIIRIERLSDSFKQGKFFVTINENISDSSQLILCQTITKKFNEFSNIVICLYADNSVGNDLARGNKENVSLEEHKRYWLAMYSYNAVEGEYFDNYPSGYLGVQ